VINTSPSIDSFQRFPADDSSKYPELYAAATGLGVGLPPDRAYEDSATHLTVQEPAYALQQRQGYRAGSPVVPILEKFGDQPASEDKTFADYKTGPVGAHSPYGSRAASVRSGRQGSTFTTATARQAAHREAHERMVAKRQQQRKRRLIVIGVVVTIVLLAMVIPVAYVTSQKSNDPAPTTTRRPNRNSTGTPNAADSSLLGRYYASDSLWNPLVIPPGNDLQSGGDGDSVTAYVNGSIVKFTYVNEFGGTFYHDPTNPFSKGGKAQSWTPAIGEEWVWGTDRVRGVNLGGWFVLEPFIVPAMFQGQWAGTLNERQVDFAFALDRRCPEPQDRASY
jgi:hypothetical protein